MLCPSVRFQIRSPTSPAQGSESGIRRKVVSKRQPDCDAEAAQLRDPFCFALPDAATRARLMLPASWRA
jgi:hypothetical protein